MDGNELAHARKNRDRPTNDLDCVEQRTVCQGMGVDDHIRAKGFDQGGNLPTRRDLYHAEAAVTSRIVENVIEPTVQPGRYANARRVQLGRYLKRAAPAESEHILNLDVDTVAVMVAKCSGD